MIIMVKRVREGDHNYISGLTKFISSYRNANQMLPHLLLHMPCITLAVLTVNTRNNTLLPLKVHDDVYMQVLCGLKAEIY